MAVTPHPSVVSRLLLLSGTERGVKPRRKTLAVECNVQYAIRAQFEIQYRIRTRRKVKPVHFLCPFLEGPEDQRRGKFGVISTLKVIG